VDQDQEGRAGLTEDDYEPDPIDLQDAARGHMTPGDGSDADYSGDTGGAQDERRCDTEQMGAYV
jgi:hypothetical protein